MEIYGSSEITVHKLNELREEDSKIQIVDVREDTEREHSPLAKWTATQQMIDNKTTFYVCQDFACKIPTTDIKQAIEFINE